ncbi:unnamed protein product [marine sediment metagenome]|uniref:Uncharacterized protein n=1 Tax=marine sediment metagenome TaxID=412755 RepID=X0T4A0_9ZZZZ
MRNLSSPHGKISTVQFFSDGLNNTLRGCVNKFENAGYRVQFVPTAGQPAVWFGHYELVGQSAIVDFAEQLSSVKEL